MTPPSRDFHGQASVDTKPAANQLYHEYVFDGNETALQFWGTIPRNMIEALELSHSLVEQYQKEAQPVFTLERVAQLCKAIRDLHQKRQMLTPPVKNNLIRMQENLEVVEAGHQPVILGGPGLIINKLATIHKFSQLEPVIPLMFMGDHDQEQKELTVIHLPSPGPRGINFSLPIPREFQQSPMHIIPLPPKSWLEKTLQKIKSTYHELATNAPRPQRDTYTERIRFILDLVKTTYDQASSLSDWTLRLWMQIVNQQEDSGLLFQAFSHPVIQNMMLPAFEYLLKPKIREPFITALNQVSEKLQHLGYQPGIGPRLDSYTPFHLECPTQDCNRTRLDPILAKSKSARMEITATCPKCKESHSIEVKSAEPDLSPWKANLSPRVDTRAFLVQSYAPITLHVGGAGETNYYAQVIPALESIRSTAPTFFRYTRFFYTNPWTLRLSQKLEQEHLIPLSLNRIESYTSAIQTGIKEENLGVVCSLFAAVEEYIIDVSNQLIQTETTLDQERQDAISQQRNTSDTNARKELQTKIGQMTRIRQLLQTYLSQMFGRYAPERFGQEVSFTWVDMGVSVGGPFLFRKLTSTYNGFTPAAASFLLHDIY